MLVYIERTSPYSRNHAVKRPRPKRPFSRLADRSMLSDDDEVRLGALLVVVAVALDSFDVLPFRVWRREADQLQMQRTFDRSAFR